MSLGNSIRNEEQVRAILREAADRRELVILQTPYLRVESQFLKVDEEGFHVVATMNREDALYALKSDDLRIRFPHRASFFEADTAMLGLGISDGRRSIRLRFPTELRDDEQRGAYRVDRVGRVVATFGTRRFDLMTASLVNLSLTGARLMALQDLPDDALSVGDDISVTIPLNETIRINTYAKVRYRQDRVFGIQYRTELGEALLGNLSRWVFQKREEDRERLARRGSAEAPGSEGGSGGPKGILLVSASPDLESELGSLFKEVQPLARSLPAVQGLKQGLSAQPMLVIFHAPVLGLDERKRFKLLAEAVPDKVPLLLLGAAGVEVAALQELGTDLKAVATYAWGPGKGAFFLRLVQGILRRHHGEAAKEGEDR